MSVFNEFERCSAEDCDSRAQRDGLCGKHHQRVRRWGTPEKVHQRGRPSTSPVTPDVVAQVKRMRGRLEPNIAIAKATGLSLKTVSKIIKGGYE